MVVMIDDWCGSCSVEWLVGETARRYGILVPQDSVAIAGNVRMTTEDGSLLLPSDRVAGIVGDAHRSGPVRLLATDVASIQVALLSPVGGRV